MAAAPPHPPPRPTTTSPSSPTSRGHDARAGDAAATPRARTPRSEPFVVPGAASCGGGIASVLASRSRRRAFASARASRSRRRALVVRPPIAPASSRVRRRYASCAAGKRTRPCQGVCASAGVRVLRARAVREEGPPARWRAWRAAATREGGVRSSGRMTSARQHTPGAAPPSRFGRGVRAMCRYAIRGAHTPTHRAEHVTKRARNAADHARPRHPSPHCPGTRCSGRRRTRPRGGKAAHACWPHKMRSARGRAKHGGATPHTPRIRFPRALCSTSASPSSSSTGGT